MVGGCTRGGKEEEEGEGVQGGTMEEKEISAQSAPCGNWHSWLPVPAPSGDYLPEAGSEYRLIQPPAVTYPRELDQLEILIPLPRVTTAGD